ncbi:hypothetical protein [uncultured Mailhella sp.]
MKEASKEKNNYLFFNMLKGGVQGCVGGTQRKLIFDMADILKMSAA